MSESEGLWLKTVGAPTENDGRNGELHLTSGTLPPERFALEPWDEDIDGVDAYYLLTSRTPELDEEGRLVWMYSYDGLVEPWPDDAARKSE